jgi:hypothetical protein
MFIVNNPLLVVDTLLWMTALSRQRQGSKGALAVTRETAAAEIQAKKRLQWYSSQQQRTVWPHPAEGSPGFDDRAFIHVEVGVPRTTPPNFCRGGSGPPPPPPSRSSKPGIVVYQGQFFRNF